MKRKRSRAVPIGDIQAFLERGVMNQQLMGAIQSAVQEKAGLYESEQLLMRKKQIEWRTQSRYRTRTSVLIHMTKAACAAQYHPLLEKLPEFVTFYTCENKTEEPAYYCHLCKTGPKKLKYARTYTICQNVHECWDRLIPVKFASLLLLIQVVNDYSK